MNKVSLFFGDSLTSGDNNGGKSYVSYLANRTTINLGVSGTTIGEYSIYPVDGYSLLSQINNNKQHIENADEIFLEYGLNDTASIAVYNVSETKVIISFVKAIDAIKQINNKAKIYFIAFSTGSGYIENQCEYLMKDYFKGLNIFVSEEAFRSIYNRLVSTFEKKVDVLIKIPSFITYLDKDKLHPNDRGYRMIAKEINKCVF